MSASLSENSQPKLKIRQISFRTHAHATESIEKVKGIFTDILGIELNEKEIQIDNCSGTFGQRITNIEVNFKVQKKIKVILSVLTEKLSDSDKKFLSKSFQQRLDEKYKFFFRLDKQYAVIDQVKIARHPDVIQVIVAVQNRNLQIPLTVEIVRDYFKTLNLII